MTDYDVEVQLECSLSVERITHLLGARGGGDCVIFVALFSEIQALKVLEPFRALRVFCVTS
jgi:hypothetical protein